jgi:hypothetical protein
VRELRDKAAFDAPATTVAKSADAGRNTLSDAVDGASGAQYTSASLFTARAAATEPTGDEPPLPEAAAPDAAGPAPTTAPAAGAPAPVDPHPVPDVADAVSVSPGDDPEAKERIYGDGHHKAHGAPFERKKKHAEHHVAKRDKFNKPSIKSDKIGKNVAARPGVIMNTKKGRDGVFMLKQKSAIRYQYVQRDGQLIAEPYDTIDRKDLAHGNYKARGAEHGTNGNVKRLLMNPSMPRELVINGQPEMCVFTWIDGMTAAWIPVDQLEGSRKQILNAARTRAHRWDPALVSHDPQKILKHSKHYIIRNDAVGQATKADEHTVANIDHPRVLDAGAKGGNNVSHYLNKDIRKMGFDASGKAIGKNVTRSVVALNMNLPAPDVPPIAIDTLQAGQSFFVMREKTFHRQVPVFENGKHKSSLLQMWVFGHVGMRDHTGKLVPDPDRRGWVPLRVLADAGHVATHDITQRIPKHD